MANVTKVTPEKRARFLAQLAEGYSVKRAAASIGVSRKSMYEHRAAEADFAADWDAALEEGTEVLEDEARRRAVEGVTLEKSHYHLGQLAGVDVETRYSDTLLIFLLKARKPDTYRERASIEHTGKGGGPIEVEDTTPPEQRAALVAAIIEGALARRDDA